MQKVEKNYFKSYEINVDGYFLRPPFGEAFE
jgi:hypothetical protein